MLDEATFASLTAAHRRELHVHSYRMLGNFDAAASLALIRADVRVSMPPQPLLFSGARVPPRGAGPRRASAFPTGTAFRNFTTIFG